MLESFIWIFVHNLGQSRIRFYYIRVSREGKKEYRIIKAIKNKLSNLRSMNFRVVAGEQQKNYYK